MLKFYCINIDDLPDPLTNPDVMEGLPEDRKEKCVFFRHSDHRKRALGAGLIIQRIMQDNNCTSEIHLTKNGKPEVDGIHFNVSHGGDFVIGVSAPCPVGCDIEPIMPPPLEIADIFFHHGETEYLNNHPYKTFAFWQLWTLKESYMKMTGKGMSLELDKFQIVMSDPVSVIRDDISDNCGFKHLIWKDHYVAFCFQEEKYRSQDVKWNYVF